MRDDVNLKTSLYKRIVEAKLFIDRHYNEDVSADNIANEACFSKFHFIRLFKRTYGYSPHKYLKIVRIHHAKRLLSSGNSVKDVCFSIGFDSVTSFAGLFKKITKLSPSDYQMKQQQLKEDVIQMPAKYIPGCYLKGPFLTKSNFEEVNSGSS